MEDSYSHLSLNLTSNISEWPQGQFVFGESLLTHEDILFEEYEIPLGFVIPLVCVYCFVVFLGVGGNIAVGYTICTVKMLRTVTNFFLASLSVSDILMTILCIPTTIASNIIFQYWVFGAAMCPVVHYVQLVVVLQRAFVMVAITCDRHYVISRPLRKRMTKKKAKILILGLWISACFIALPTAVHARITYMPMKPGSNGLCIEQWNNIRLQHMYSVTILLLQYFMPLLIMACAYLHIGYMIWVKPTPGEPDRERDIKIARSKRKSLKMLFIVVTVYAVTWLPIHIFTLIGDSNPTFFNQKFAHMLWLSFHWLAFSNSAMNPLIYWWINKSFRQRLNLFCYRIFCGWKYTKIFRNQKFTVRLKSEPSMVNSSRERHIYNESPTFLHIPRRAQNTPISSERNSYELTIML